ncbi:glycerol-3-phosphate ABC transporter permease, partial [Halorubrum ezzemoulense]
MVGVLQYAKRRVDALRGNYETQRIHEDDLGTHFQLLLLVVAVVFPIAVALAVSTKQSGVVTSVVDLLPGGYA